MRPKVFVVQPIPAEPLAVLEEVADVEVFDNVRRQINLEETIAGAKRSDYLVALHDVQYFCGEGGPGDDRTFLSL
jgi:hypothetical protein